MLASTNVTAVRVIREVSSVVVGSSDLEGKRTYFLDVKEAKTGDKYLVITGSRFQGEDEDRERSSVMVFADSLDEFTEAFHEVVKLI